MTDKIDNLIATNFKFSHKEEYYSSILVNAIKQSLSKRASYKCESLHLELKLDLKDFKSKTYNSIDFLDSENNSIYTIFFEDFYFINTYMKIDLRGLPIFVLDDTYLIQFNDN